jgi:molybdopterin molybdotransferase
MVSVAEANHIIHHAVRPLAPVLAPLNEAAGLVLAEDIYAPEPLPRFHQSAMDGYAFNWADLKNAHGLSVCGEVAAGDGEPFQLKVGTAVRIFTGAPMPPGADVVVMQEKTTVVAGVLKVADAFLQKGSNVRRMGSEIQQHQLALPVGTLLSPGAIGIIASMGIPEVWVTPPPRVALIITGKELIAPGTTPAFGQVHESNSFALLAALKKIGVAGARVLFVTDTLQAVQNALEESLLQSDLVIVTGGVSVGKYDFVVEASVRVGVETLFHKVAQKPAKPLYFGSRQSKPVFGLPGNPGSVLTCFYLYVLPAIAGMMQQQGWRRMSKMILGAEVRKKAGVTYFLKGRLEENRVVPLGAQESYRLSSFAFADCLIELPEDKEVVEKGSIVQVHHL